MLRAHVPQPSEIKGVSTLRHCRRFVAAAQARRTMSDLTSRSEPLKWHTETGDIRRGGTNAREPSVQSGVQAAGREAASGQGGSQGHGQVPSIVCPASCWTSGGGPISAGPSGAAPSGAAPEGGGTCERRREPAADCARPVASWAVRESSRTARRPYASPAGAQGRRPGAGDRCFQRSLAAREGTPGAIPIRPIALAGAITYQPDHASRSTVSRRGS
jgi:hypothetical protein